MPCIHMIYRMADILVTLTYFFFGVIECSIAIGEILQMYNNCMDKCPLTFSSNVTYPTELSNNKICKLCQT